MYLRRKKKTKNQIIITLVGTSICRIIESTAIGRATGFN